MFVAGVPSLPPPSKNNVNICVLGRAGSQDKSSAWNPYILVKIWCNSLIIMLYNRTHALAVNVDRVNPGPFFSGL